MAENKPRGERASPRRRVEATATEEAVEAFAGDAQRVDAEAVRARAEAPDLLSPRALDERQAAIGERRRRGGPPLRSGTRRATEESAPDVPPTGCAEPPA